MNELAKSISKNLLKHDSEIEQRIQMGIETNRKGSGTIKVKGADGKLVEKCKIKLRHTQHEFHFGCNAFMLDQFPEKEQNECYRETFANLFNLAVLPFFWSDLEPENGKLRFDKNTRSIYRRPQPDLVLDFCEEKNIIPKGHPLLWHCFRPEWLTHDASKMRERIHRRFREIAERYADRIKIWDVCNEAQTVAVDSPERELPDNHLELAFDLAARYFSDCVKTYNDNNMWFQYSRKYSPVYLLIKSLLDRGYQVDALGLQFHMFERLYRYSDKFMNPDILFRCLDLYAKLEVPINFSEVSIIGRRDLGDGDAFQELVARKLYRLWFSHAAVNGIIWWNMVDGTAAYAPIGSEDGENALRAGLVNFDFTHKPAYTALHNLIKTEWCTNTTMAYSVDGINKFNGFYGKYDVEIETNSGTFQQTLDLSKGTLNEFKLEIG